MSDSPVALAHEIAQVWSEVLAVDDVVPSDNFFVLGGNSLMAAVAIGKLQERDIAVTVPAFFLAPTLADLVAIITSDASVMPR